jgi:hypothetical protein
MPCLQQFHHKRVHVGDLAASGIKHENAVPCGFKEPAVADFGGPYCLWYCLMLSYPVGLIGQLIISVSITSP